MVIYKLTRTSTSSLLRSPLLINWAFNPSVHLVTWIRDGRFWRINFFCQEIILIVFVFHRRLLQSIKQNTTSINTSSHSVYFHSENKILQGRYFFIERVWSTKFLNYVEHYWAESQLLSFVADSTNGLVATILSKIISDIFLT